MAAFMKAPGGFGGAGVFTRRSAPSSTTQPTLGSSMSASKDRPVPTLGGAISAAEPESRSCPVSQRLSCQDIIRMGKTRSQEQLDFPELKETLAKYGLSAECEAGSMAKAMENFLKNHKTAASEKDSIFGQRTQTAQPGPTDAGPLVQSDTAFRIRGSDELDELEKHTKTINRILNKLTPEKYDTLCEQLLEAPGLYDNQDFMAETIALIYDRAINQPSFCQMYSQLSRRLADEEVRRDGEEKAKKTSVYRRQLLQQVQKEYENFKKAPAEGQAEARKKRKLGNIQFVGELYKQGMLTDTVMHSIIEGQLKGTGTTPPPADFRPEEEDLEVICKLFSTTGKDLDARAARNPANKKKLDEFFAIMNDLAAHDGYIPRIKFNLINTIDLRRNGWPTKGTQAKTLKDLEKETEERERQKLEGNKHSHFSGDKTAWGAAAEIHTALKIDPKASKQGPKKKKDDDEGWTNTKKSTKGKQQPAKGPAKPSQAKVSAGAYGGLGSSSPKDQEKKKKKKDEPKDKKEKKEKKDKKDKKGADQEDDDKKDRVPPSDFNNQLRTVVAARVEECMMEPADKRPEILKEDFEKFRSMVDESQEMQPLVVCEVLHEMARANDAAKRQLLTEYLEFVCEGNKAEEKEKLDKETSIKRSDMVRGFGWFLCTAAFTRMEENYPKVYERCIEAMVKLIPPQTCYGELTKSFQLAMKGLKTLFDAQEEDEHLVDSVEEFFEELINNVWMKVNKGLIPGEGELSNILNFVLSLCHKNTFPYFPTYGDDEPKSMMCVMMEFLVAEGVVTPAGIAEWIDDLEATKKKSGKIVEKTRKHLASILGMEGGEEEEEEDEEQAEDDEENKEEDAEE